LETSSVEVTDNDAASTTIRQQFHQGACTALLTLFAFTNYGVKQPEARAFQF
jgi:hypothetical protein